MATEKAKAYLASLASYFASFLCNLAVVGMGVALFKEDNYKAAFSLALFALLFGASIALIPAIVKRGQK